MSSHFSKVDLTIYSNFAHIIITEPILNNEMKSLSILDSTDPKSIIVMYLNQDGDIFPIKYEMIQSKKSFKKGDNIIVSENIGSYQNNISGKIYDQSDKWIDIISDVTVNNNLNSKIIRVYNPNQLSSDCKPTADKINVFLSSLPLSTARGINSNGNIQLSYIFNDIGWNTHYTLIINSNDINNIKLFKAIGQIQNSTTQIINVDNLRLMAGKPNRPISYNNEIMSEPKGSKALLASSAPSASFSTNFSPELLSVDEYESYEIGSKTLDKYTYVDLFTIKDMEAKRFYHHYIESQKQTTFGFIFNTSQFLPEGNIYIYTQADKGIGNYIGSSYIHEYRKGDEVEFEIGSTTQVKCESILEKKVEQLKEPINQNQDNNDRGYIYQERHTYTFKTNIINRSSYPANVLLSLYIGTGKLENIILSPKSPNPIISRRKEGNIDWMFVIPSSLPSTTSSFQSPLRSVQSASYQTSQPLQSASYQTPQPLQPASYQTSQPLQPVSYQTSQPLQPVSYQTSQPLQPVSYQTSQPLQPVSQLLLQSSLQSVQPGSYQTSQSLQPASQSSFQSSSYPSLQPTLQISSDITNITIEGQVIFIL